MYLDTWLPHRSALEYAFDVTVRTVVCGEEGRGSWSVCQFLMAKIRTFVPAF
jgi:hypothetical protein